MALLSRGRSRRDTEDDGNVVAEAPGSGAQPCQAARLLREALEAYASDSVADDLLRIALRRAGLSALPQTSDALALFVDEHLLPAAREISDDLADAVRQHLASILARLRQMGAEGKMRTSEPPDAAAPTREISLRPFSVVLVVGRDREVAQRMREELGSGTAVIPVDNGAELVRDLRLLQNQPRLLIVDLRRPHSLLEAVRSDPALLAGATIVVWGARRKDEDEIKRTFRVKLVRCGADASPEDLAAIVRIGPGR